MQCNQRLLKTPRVLAGTMLEMKIYPDAKVLQGQSRLSEGQKMMGERVVLTCVSLRKRRVLTKRKKNNHPEATKELESYFE